MRALRLFAVLGFLVALAGCWTGAPFYTAADSRLALSPGDYTTTSVTPDENGRVRVSIRRDNMTLITPIGADGTPDEGDAIVLGFASIPGEGALFAAWLTEAGGSILPRDTVTYALLSRHEDGVYTLTVPGCTGNEAGATVTRDSETTICHFATRAALEGALRGIGRGGHVIRLSPVARP